MISWERVVLSDPENKTVTVVGLGYVGCVSVACLASDGIQIIGVDINESKVASVGSGLPTIFEPGLDELMADVHQKGLVRATVDLEAAVRESSVSLITVGTPSSEAGELDLSFVFRVADEIGRGLRNGAGHHTVGLRSTVRPGTCAEVIARIESASGKCHGEDFSVVANPEFLREGSAISDFRNPPFVLVGADDERGAQAIASIYEKVQSETLIVDVTAAEIIKYVNNSWHALKVAFGNEVGSICKALGISSREVIELFFQDRILNISPAYLRPGFAFGGTCLPKDLRALSALARDTGGAAEPTIVSRTLSTDHSDSAMLRSAPFTRARARSPYIRGQRRWASPRRTNGGVPASETRLYSVTTHRVSRIFLPELDDRSQQPSARSTEGCWSVLFGSHRISMTFRPTIPDRSVDLH